MLNGLTRTYFIHVIVSTYKREIQLTHDELLMISSKYLIKGCKVKI